METRELSGRARLGRRTKDLVKRLGPDDIAIVDHADLDRVSAEELAESGIRGVVNVAQSTHRSLPEPRAAGARARRRDGDRHTRSATVRDAADGEPIRLVGNQVWRNGTMLTEGVALDAVTLERSLAEQQARVGEALGAFADNTLRHLRDEAGDLVVGIAFPPLDDAAA